VENTQLYKTEEGGRDGVKFMNLKLNAICVPWHSVSSAIIAWLQDYITDYAAYRKGNLENNSSQMVKKHCLLVCSSAQMLYMLLYLLDVMEFFY
jgi:hypothetical protein